MKKSSYPENVLVVGPVASLGGIASVMRLHSTTSLWQTVNCHVLSTYDERNVFTKVLSMLRAYVIAPRMIRRASLVHIHLAAQFSMGRKLPIVLLTKLLRRPYVVHLHAASEASLFEATPQWLVRTIFLLSYRVIVLSDHWATVVKTNVPTARISIIHNPVLSPAFLSRRRATGCPVVLFVGKLEERKGYRELLEAASLVLMRFPDVQFWFVGNGEIELAKKQARFLGIDRSVTFAGWMAPEFMEHFYRDASIFCLPSHDEGQPMSVLEAMSYALPVICTPVGALPELIIDRVNGFLTPVGDVVSLESQILKLLRNPEMAVSVGAYGAATVEKECGIARIEEELGRLYQEVESEWIRRRRGQREAVLIPTDEAV